MSHLIPRRAAGAALGALLLLAGCTKRVPLAGERRARLGTTSTVLYLSPAGLGVTVDRSGASLSVLGASLGVVGALVGLAVGTALDASIIESRKATAEAAAWPVRDGLLGYDPGATLKASLTRRLGQIRWMRNVQVEVRPVPDPVGSQPAVLLASGLVDSVLVVAADPVLTPGFEGLAVQGYAALVSAPAEPRGKPVILYTNEFWVHVTLDEPEAMISDLPGGPPGPEKPSLEEAARYWGDEGGMEARRALDLCFSELARLIAYDLEVGDPQEARQKERVHAGTMIIKDTSSRLLAGTIEYRDGPRTWLRMGDGVLYSVGRLPDAPAGQQPGPPPALP